MEELLKNAEKGIIELNSRLQMLMVDEKANETFVEHINMRVKSEKSIREKLERKGLEFNTQNVSQYIRDLGGIRVTVLFISDVYKVFDWLKSQDDLEITRIKDYIKHPKKSGYQSLHANILVPIQTSDGVKKVEVEIQIRTEGMDFFASIEHLLKYKSGEIDEDISKRLLKCAKHVKTLDKEMFSIYNSILQRD